MQYHTILGAFLLSVTACDTADNMTMRQHQVDAAEGSKLTLADAIPAAEAQLPNGIAVGADLEFVHGAAVYEVELFVDGVKHLVRFGPEPGKIVRSRIKERWTPEGKENTSLVQTSVGWPKLIIAAEDVVGGLAYEGWTEGADGMFKVVVLAEDTVFEVAMSPTGEVLKVQFGTGDEW